MKQKNLPIIGLTGILFLSLILFSCTKSFDDELITDPDLDNPSLKCGILKGVVLTPKELLGKNIFFDNISSPGTMSCSDCHTPFVGFTGPRPGVNLLWAVYPGADPRKFGNRKPPSSAYATQSPIFHYDAVEGLFIGGNFWDGRATGERLGSPSAEQALGPFLNPVEHNLPDKLAVLLKIEKAKYIGMWKEVWGEPFSTEAGKVSLNYDRIGLAIAAYEASAEVNQFSSKFDRYLKGMEQLTAKEALGLAIFNGKGKCNLCHISDGTQPLFTDYTFDNLGAPKNPGNPVYKYDPGFIDPGLGGFLATRPEWSAMAGDNMGKHKVPTLRNVGKKPGRGFTKAYLHNGVFKSLKDVVHFYNTRDVGTWPAPEVSANVNTSELGNLGLSGAEEDALVAFMETLSDRNVIN